MMIFCMQWCRDDALPIEEILVAFDLDRSGFEREIARIQKRKTKIILYFSCVYIIMSNINNNTKGQQND